MNRGARYAHQRSNRVRLKADCDVLLRRIQRYGATDLVDSIAEMRVRLNPPTGAAAPIVLTGYTGKGSKKKREPKPPIDWKATAVIRTRPVDGVDVRFLDLDAPVDFVRYRKD